MLKNDLKRERFGGRVDDPFLSARDLKEAMTIMAKGGWTASAVLGVALAGAADAGHGSDEEERMHGEVLLRRRSGELWRDFRPGPLFICNRAPVRVTPAQSVTDSSLWTRTCVICVSFVF